MRLTINISDRIADELSQLIEHYNSGDKSEVTVTAEGAARMLLEDAIDNAYYEYLEKKH